MSNLSEPRKSTAEIANDLVLPIVIFLNRDITKSYDGPSAADLIKQALDTERSQAIQGLSVEDREILLRDIQRQSSIIEQKDREIDQLKAVKLSANCCASCGWLLPNHSEDCGRYELVVADLRKEVERLQSKLSANPADWPEVKLQDKCDELEKKIATLKEELKRYYTSRVIKELQAQSLLLIEALKFVEKRLEDLGHHETGGMRATINEALHSPQTQALVPRQGKMERVVEAVKEFSRITHHKVDGEDRRLWTNDAQDAADKLFDRFDELEADLGK